MKKFLFPFLFVGAILLMGCPLQTQKSIDEGSYDVPSWLFGKWKGKAKTDEKTTTYLVKKVEGNKTKARAYVCDEKGTPNSEYKDIIFSTVGNKFFINVYEPGDSSLTDPGYYIYKLDKVSEKEFNLLPVLEHKIDYEVEPKELKAWLLEHKDDNSIFDVANIENYKKE